MNRKVKVADWKPGGQVANCSSGQKHRHTVSARNVANLCQRILLSVGEAVLKKINVIGHALTIWEEVSAPRPGKFR